MSETAPSHQSISYCPYCSEETLFPLETGWECRSCLRTFTVTFQGLARARADVRGTTSDAGPAPSVTGVSA